MDKQYLSEGILCYAHYSITISYTQWVQNHILETWLRLLVYTDVHVQFCFWDVFLYS